MLKPRPTAPPPAVEYFLDCAVQAAEMDSCTGLTLRLYGEDAALIPLIGTPLERSSTWRERAELCLNLGHMADNALARVPPERAAALVRHGMAFAASELVDLAETFAMWANTDEIEGGCLLGWRTQVRARNGVTFKRTARRLRSRKFIRRYVRHNLIEAQHLRALLEMQVRRFHNWGAGRDPTLDADVRAQFNYRRLEEAKVDRDLELRRRKIILRSLKQAVSIVGEDAVRTFLRGEDVKLIGQHAILTVRKRGRLSDRGHGVLSVGLAARDGTSLADLCTYVEDTPTLDQLSAFALWMASGEEKAVMRTANITALTDAGRNHPLVKAMRRPEPTHEEVMANIIAVHGEQVGTQIIQVINIGRDRLRPIIRQYTYEERRSRERAYWEETKAWWIEAFVALVMGYKNLPIFKAAGVM